MTNLPERRELRISDAERDRTASILREAAGDGRLDLEELDERLSAVYAAKTYGDLEPITRDLPETSEAPAPAKSNRIGGKATSAFAFAMMGGFQRKGSWVVAEEFNSVAVMGGGELDLREARFAGPVVTIRAIAIMGGIEIVVPEDAEVHISGIGIMGGFEQNAAGAGSPGAPRINITGVAFWGGVSVKRKPTQEEMRQRKLERKREKLERKHGL